MNTDNHQRRAYALIRMSRTVDRVIVAKTDADKTNAARYPQVKKKLWGGEFWTDGYFARSAGKHGDENMNGKYVKNQGNEYHKLHEDRQLAFF